MVTVSLTIAIDIHNYTEIVESQKGWFLGALTYLPILSWAIRRKVDSKIECEVKSALVEPIRKNVRDRLAARGIQAEVKVL